MTHFNWSEFLKQWSQEILEDGQDQQLQNLDKDQQEQWLGYPGATEEQILAVEARLGITLPPSYRAFLKASNGWKETTPFIKHLWSVDKIAWFAETHPEWFQQWLERYDNSPSSDINGTASQSTITDEEYFVYGEEQDCRQIRVNYLETALEISEVNDAALYLLNPDVMTEDGEWEAWFLADWLPGADRYPSFRAMMQAEYINSREIRAAVTEVDDNGIDSNTNPPNAVINTTDWSELAINTVAQWLIHQTLPAIRSHNSSLTRQLQNHQNQDFKDVTVSILPTPTVQLANQSQQWPGIEVNKVCHWMIEQIALTVSL